MSKEKTKLLEKLFENKDKFKEHQFKTLFFLINDYFSKENKAKTQPRGLTNEIIGKGIGRSARRVRFIIYELRDLNLLDTETSLYKDKFRTVDITKLIEWLKK